MPSEEAITRQHRQNAQYREYLAGLPEKQRARLLKVLSSGDRAEALKHGLSSVLLEHYESEQGSKDVSEWVELAGPETALREKLADRLAEEFHLAPSVAAAIGALFEVLIDAEADRRKSLQLSRIVGGLVRAGNVKVRTHCLAIAAQLDELNNLGYRNLTQAGSQLGTSKANMSKGVNEWCDLLDLPRPPMLKSQAARESYSVHRKNHHWRKEKCPKPKQP